MRRIVRSLAVAAVAILSLTGCAAFWDYVEASGETPDAVGAAPPPPPPPTEPAPPPVEPVPEIMPAPQPAPPPPEAMPEEEPRDGAGSDFAMPEFPWPPPRWSARAALPRAAFVGDATLSDAASRIVAALDAAGYGERSFYKVPGGFAIVARLERMNEDGTPNAEYRFLSPNAEEPFDLGDYVAALFFTPEGFYRQIVFVATDRPFVAAEEAPTVAEAEEALGGGATGLSSELAAQPLTGAHEVSALIYEFRKGAGPEDVAILTPGRLDGLAHLERSGIGRAFAPR